MAKTVQEALEERKKRYSFNSTEDKVSAALEARKKRLEEDKESTLADIRDRLISEGEAYNEYITNSSDLTWGNADLGSVLDDQRERTIAVSKLQRDIEANRSLYGDSITEEMLNEVNKISGGYSGVLNNAKLYSEFGSEDEYKSHVKEQEEKLKEYQAWQEDQEKKKAFDTTAGQKEIEELEALLKQAEEWEGRKNTSTPTTTGMPSATVVPAAGGVDSRNQNAYNSEMQNPYLQQYGFGNIAEMKEAIANRRVYLREAQELQTITGMGSEAKADPEFNKWASQGAAIENPTFEEGMGGFFGIGAQEPNNLVTFEREKYELLKGFYDSEPDSLHPSVLMTEDEVSIWNYYLAQDKANGTNRANEFYEALLPTLDARKAHGVAEQKMDNVVEATLFNLSTGVETFFTNVGNNFSDEDYIRPTVNQMAQSMIRQEYEDDGKWLATTAFDLASTTGNMLPAILASYATAGIASGLGLSAGAAGIAGKMGMSLAMGTSSMGAGYAEMLNLGYSKDQARAYGAMVGIAETASSYLLGSIGGGGKGADGILSGLTTKVLGKVDNAIARAAIQIGGSMGSEFIEEGLQTAIEPWLKSVATGVDFEAAGIDEILYSGLLGALSAGVLEGPGIVAEGVQTRNMGKTVQNVDGGVQKLQQIGNTFSADTVAYKLANKIDENTGAYTIGRLYQEVGATISEQNVADIVAGLEAKGLDTETATKLARQYQSYVNEDITLNQMGVEVLEKNTPLAHVLRNDLIGRNTTVYQRSNEYADLFSLAERVANGETDVMTDESADDNATSVEGNIAEDYGNWQTAQDIHKSILSDISSRPSLYSSAEQKIATDENIKRTAADIAVSDKLGLKGEYTSNDTGATRLKDTKQKVEILDVVSVKNGDMRLKVKDGKAVKTVNAKDINFSTASEALVYEAVANMGVDAVTAWSIIKGFNPQSKQSGAVYALGAIEAYGYGNTGLEATDISDRGFAKMLTEMQRNTAHRLGKIAKDSKAKTEQKTLDAKVNAKVNANGNKPIAKQSGRVIFDGDIDRDSLVKDEFRSGQIKVLEKFAEKLGITFHLYESKVAKVGGKDTRVYTDASGKKITASGIYSKATGEVWVDINAGNFGEGTILYTASHELTHFIRQWSPEKYQTFANFLIEQYGKKGVSVNELINAQIAKAKRNGRKLSKEAALDEVVADSCESFLMDSNIAEKISLLAEKDKSLVEKIKSFIGSLLKKLRAFVAEEGYAPNSAEGKFVQEMTDALEQLHALWTDALVGASRTYGKLTAQQANTLAESGIGVDEVTGEVYALRDSFATNDKITIGKKSFDVEAVAALVKEATGRSIEDARKWVQSEMTIANIVMKNPEFLDFEVDDRYEAIKKNSDYPQGTVDLSNLCPKRQEFTSMFDMLQKKYPKKLFTASDVAKMRAILAEEGITVACGACFVEDRRQLLGEIADTYINMWKEAVDTGNPLHKTNAEGKKIKLTVTAALAKQYGVTKGADILATDKYIPTQYDLTTYEGFKLLEKNHPTIAMGFNRYNNSRGQQSGRLIEGRAEYKRQILGWSENKVKSVNNNGGLRIFSFSDFEVVHLLDLAQVIIDCAAKGVKIQGYTKIPAFAKLVRNTGIKLNRSFIPKGETGIKVVNGKRVLDIDTTEGIDTNDENFLDESDNPDVGNVIIGINPEQIGIAMMDDTIDYIIPFHSNKAKAILRELGLESWVNYKESQHEKDIATGSASKKNVNIYTQVINKYKPTNKVEFVEAFLKECKAQGKIPRYSEFLNVDSNGDYAYREGYHKFLVDFKMFDKEGNILPQGFVTPDLDSGFMTELLNDEVDKKANYEFPQEVYDKIDEQFGEDVQGTYIQYSSRESLSEASSKLETISDEEYLKDKASNPFVLVMEHTPKVILDSIEGRKDRRIIIRRDALYLAIREDGIQEGNYHGLGKEVLSKLPEYLEQPDVILSTIDPNTNTENTDRRLVLTHIPAKNGQAIVSVEFESLKDFEGKNDYFNMIITVFDLHKNYLKRQFDKFGAKVKYQKKDLAQVNPQLFDWLRTVNAKSSEGSIPQPSDSVNTSDENLFSERDIVDIPNNKYVEMYHHFGSTKNYDVAGYMLGNGAMLDFSGKHWGDTTSRSRQVDHRDVQEVLDDRGDNGINAMIDMIGNGNIRLMPEVGGINLAVKPNETQMTGLRGYINHFRGEVVVDIDKVGGDTIHSFAYTRGTSSSKILSDIKAYFDNVVVPEQKAKGETDIRQFLYSERDNEAEQKVISALKTRAMGTKYLDNYATYTAERMEREIRTSSAKGIHDYAKSYITWVDPIDFIYATTISEQNRERIKEEAGEFDFERLKNETQPIHLTVNFETGEIVGHEGRHRMTALRDKGISNVVVIIDALNDDRHHTKPVEFMHLKGQQFGGHAKGTDMYLHNMLPLSERYADLARKFFTNNPKSGIQFQERDPDAITNRDILSNALLGAAKNNIEVKRLKEYGSKIEMLNSEEQKLGELNEQIRALYSAKGKRDMAKLRSLKDERVKTENRINTLDKMLLTLEASKPLREVLKREKDVVRKREQEKSRENFAIYKSHQEEKMEATREYYREIIRENARKARESKETAITNLKQKHLERLERAQDRRDSATLRNKIKAFKQKLEQNLLRPTERQYVPAGLAQAMIDVFDLIDTDTELYKADGTINKAQEKRNLTKEKLQDLKNEYAKLKHYEDPIYSGEFDDAIDAMLEDLRTRYEGRSLKEMDVDELYDMYDILRSIEETLADARKLIGKGEAADVYETGYAIIGEQDTIARKRKNGKRSGAQKATDNMLNLSLSPIRNIERMSGYKEGSALVDLFNDFEVGVRTKNRFAMGAYKDFEAITTGKNAKEYESAIYDDYKGKKYLDVKGRKFSVSKMQMMQAILSQDREKANKMSHIENGGLNFADLGMLRKGRLKDAISDENSHRVSNATAMVEGFREELREDKWAQEYMSAARNFFDGKAKDAVNETMLALKHRIVAKDSNYIPFEVDKSFIVREITAMDDIQKTISSYGMLQDTQKKAPQPLYMTGLNNIIDRHIEQVATIKGLAIPVRNFNKVWNVHSVEGVDTTVNKIVGENWGDKGKKLIEQTVRDLQGPRQNNQSELYKKVKSGYIGATFLLNGSVVAKQIGSLFSATSMIRWRDPVRMTGNLIYTMANFKKIAAEVDKYTASAWMRRQGMSDAEVYTLLTEGKRSKITTALNKLPAPLNPSKWITAMDSAVALSLWKYCKADTKKAHPELEGEELNRATANLYDTVIENTQSMTDVLHRPEIQKRDDFWGETFGMFKTDLYQMAGQLQNTVGKFNANKSKKNAAALGRTVYSVLGSALWGQLMTTAFALLRYKVNQYRDDEDELTVESWLKRQGFAFGGDMVGYLLPIAGSEIVGIIENFAYGESKDVTESIVISALNDLAASVYSINSTLKDGDDITWDQYKKLAIKSMQVFGIPANNILRTVEAVQLHAQDIANGEFGSFEAGVDRSASQQINRIVDAYSSGEIRKARDMFDDAVEALAEKKAKGEEVGEDELNDAKSQLKSELGSVYRDGEIDKRTAQDALSNLFGESDDDIYWLFDKWDYTVENGDSDDYEKYGGFIEAVSSGVNLRATIKEYTDNGVEKKTLASQITKHYKPLYLEMSKSERARLKGYLLNAYVLLGYNRSKKSKDIDQWLKED